MAHGDHETEIKLAVPNAAAARSLLRRAGFRVMRRRVFEANTVFDAPDLALRRDSTLLRVREAGKIATLTYKGRPVPSKHKSREELELQISKASAMAAILARLGFERVFRYEKYRTEYRQASGGGTATLDETPIGVYLELEGSPSWIDRTARKLGFPESAYITASYGGLYLQWCARHGCAPTDMTFRAPEASEAPPAGKRRLTRASRSRP